MSKDLVDLIKQRQMIPYALTKGFNMESEAGDDFGLPGLCGRYPVG